jgi:hypothetical protein
VPVIPTTAAAASESVRLIRSALGVGYREVAIDVSKRRLTSVSSAFEHTSPSPDGG